MAGFYLCCGAGSRAAMKMIANDQITSRFRISAAERNPVLFAACCCHCNKIMNRLGEIDMS